MGCVSFLFFAHWLRLSFSSYHSSVVKVPTDNKLPMSLMFSLDIGTSDRQTTWVLVSDAVRLSVVSDLPCRRDHLYGSGLSILAQSFRIVNISFFDFSPFPLQQSCNSKYYGDKPVDYTHRQAIVKSAEYLNFVNIIDRTNVL
jgi:hypothetical protein